MRVVLQRVKNAAVSVAGNRISAIGKGLLLLVGIGKGNRPGFDNAALPGEAEALWKKFNEALMAEDIPVKAGKFGAHMEVSLINDGPVTFVLETEYSE